MTTQAPTQKELFNFAGIRITESETGRRRLILGNMHLASWKSKKFVNKLELSLEALHQRSVQFLTLDSIFESQRKDPNFDPNILHHTGKDRIGLCCSVAVSDIVDVIGTTVDQLSTAHHFDPDNSDIPNYIIIHGLNAHKDSRIAVAAAKCYNVPLFFTEDGFLRSATTYKDECAPIYKRCIAFNFDPYGAYFDCTNQSLVEQYLNDPELNLTEEQLARARRCIDFILENHLTKYNHQPINDHLLDDIKGKKVLVIDQSYGDMSIYRGGASDLTFKLMLEKACAENPDSTVVVKTHPDAIASDKVKAYYAGVKPNDQIKLQTEAINSISLLKQCDRVYVCTSMMGFEAMMCGKDVQIFGIPFYAGYGGATTRQYVKRQRQRSVEEIFYIFYIMYTHYINPFTNQCCEIEEAMDCLLKLREQYHQYRQQQKQQA